MSRCISEPGPWRQSDGPTSNIGYGLQIRRSNDTSSNIALIRMFHAHQSLSSSSALPSKLMHDISRELPAANPAAAEGEVSPCLLGPGLQFTRQTETWLGLRKWKGFPLSSATAVRGEWPLGTVAAVNGCELIIEARLRIWEKEERHWSSFTSYPSLSTLRSLVTRRVIPTAQPAIEATRVL